MKVAGGRALCGHFSLNRRFGLLRLHCRCYSVTSLNRTLILNPCVSFGEDPRTNTTKDTCVKRVWITFSRFTNSYSIVTTIGRIYVFSRLFLIGHLRLHCVRVLFNYFSLPDTYTQSVCVSFGEDPRTNTMKGTCVKRVWIIVAQYLVSWNKAKELSIVMTDIK
jgi:hypothetical protein